MTVHFNTIKSPLIKAHWPWPRMDIQEVSTRAEYWELYMPNIGYITVDPNNAWKADLGGAANSKRLWLNSLVSAHACLEAALNSDNDAIKILKSEAAGRIIKSYLDQYMYESNTFRDVWRDEHAVANRLFVIVAFLHVLCSETDSLIKTILTKHVSLLRLLFEADKHAQWLNDDAHYVENNHGVMMDLALAQFAVFLRVIDQQVSDRYLATSLRRLEMMFDLTFDDDGCCMENSPTYHFVNYALFSTIGRFMKEYNLGNTDKWDVKLAKARHVGNLFLRRDGTIPLVGDSEAFPGTFFPKKDDDNYSSCGIGFFPSSGFFVASLNDYHLTFRAGGSKFVHRHVDDLSLTLQYKGKDFIVDCGLYNYDIEDKLRRWFISSKAHSGIYVESMGDVRFANFASPSEMSRFISTDIKDTSFNVVAEHNLSREVVVSRSVSGDDKGITIIDSFDCEIEQRWRLQFNLHPAVQVVAKVDGFFILQHEDVLLKIKFDPNYDVRTESINYSPRFMALEKAKSLIVSASEKRVNIETVIEFVR